MRPWRGYIGTGEDRGGRGDMRPGARGGRMAGGADAGGEHGIKSVHFPPAKSSSVM